MTRGLALVLVALATASVASAGRRARSQFASAEIRRRRGRPHGAVGRGVPPGRSADRLGARSRRLEPRGAISTPTLRSSPFGSSTHGSCRPCPGPRRSWSGSPRSTRDRASALARHRDDRRLLGLRINHPREEDELELQVTQPVTRAEAAYSIATYMKLRGEARGDTHGGGRVLAPPLSEWQRVVLDRALRLVGSPYVWAGTRRSRSSCSGAAPGGFDCSGFVWRVYKMKPFDGAPGSRASSSGARRTR